MPSGIIIKGIGGFYYVASEDGAYECKARGIFRKNGLTPMVGDKVVFSITDTILKKGSMDQILERSSVLVRPAVANVNQLVVIIAVKSPDPDLLLLDKLLVTAEMNEMKAVICINKMDLDTEGKSEDLRSAYVKAGYDVLETSLKEKKGFDEFKTVLNNHISVFAGQSGVGKSTLLNKIMDTMVMETGVLSNKIDRGKHTTRHAELIELAGGGYVVDTPGFSSFELADVGYMDLQHYYPEFRNYIKECRYTGCSHVRELDCGIKKAVEREQISEGRYGRYVKLYATVRQEHDMKYRK